jgi:hypothetical protein
MLRLDLPALKRHAECGATNVQEVGCLSEVHPSFLRLSFGSMAREVIVRTQRGNTLLYAAVPAAGLQSASSENTGAHRIGTDPCQDPDCLHHML